MTDLFAPSHAMALRTLLTARLSALRSAVVAAEQASRVPLLGAGSEVSDRKDLALALQAGEVGEAQEQHLLDEMREVEAALRQMDAGAYGHCQACGEPIPLQRLMAQPTALRCTRCQAAYEHERPSPKSAAAPSGGRALPVR